MLLFSNSAQLNGLKPEMVCVLIVLAELFNETGETIYVSSALDGKHMRASLHKIGHALDFWSETFTSEEVIDELAKDVKIRLTSEYDVIAEWHDGNGQHLHVEFQPK